VTDDDPLTGYRERVGEMAARAREVSTRIASIRPSATSGDGAVTVTLTATGALSAIDFGPAARQLDLPSLAEVIMRTSQTARVQAAQATQDALMPLVGQ
jgi:DNA-binding protein YbaB